MQHIFSGVIESLFLGSQRGGGGRPSSGGGSQEEGIAMKGAQSSQMGANGKGPMV